MNDVKRARKIADADPEGALALLEKHPVLAFGPQCSFDEIHKRLELSEMRVELYERCGRHEAAEAEQADATRFLESQVEFTDEQIAADEAPGLRFSRKADLLELLGRRTEAARCGLLCADLLMARLGDKGARANLEAAAVSGLAAEGAAFPGLVGTIDDILGGSGVLAASARRQMDKDERDRAWYYRNMYLADGRAVGYTDCRECGGLVSANYRGLRCAAGHSVDWVRVVLVEDAPPGLAM